MVMDEAGRNGGNWHLAQQITQLVIKPHIMQLSITIFQQQFTHHVIYNVCYISILDYRFFNF